MSFHAFFKQNRKAPEVCRVKVSEQFLDDQGTPILWEIRRMSERENAEIRSSCTTVTFSKRQRIENFDSKRYLCKLCAEAVTYPDLKDAELQKSYGVVGAEDLLAEMLAPGEYGNLLMAVQELNGYDLESFEENVSEVKNS